MTSAKLKNNKHFDKLSTKGVVKIPFLTENELQQLTELYNQTHGKAAPPTLYDGIHMTIWHHDTKYKLDVNKGIREIIEAACERTFENYRAVSQQFIVKMNGSETTFPVHQDWSIVDEGRYRSFNLWIPLNDVDETNGAMWIIEGSHNIERKIRGAGYLFPNYIQILDQLKPYMTTYSMTAGEGLLFYHNTIHGSPFNAAVTPRIVAQVAIIPKEAPMNIYFQKGPGHQLEVHQPADDFTFYYQKIREESESRPPTDHPVEIRQGIEVKPVLLEEVLNAIGETVKHNDS
ncbi:MAG: hypothetical protein GC178_03425 [Flavobacteriales bacterium]|nr:hypothetical protein [Flavobacteriales bacterium]